MRRIAVRRNPMGGTLVRGNFMERRAARGEPMGRTLTRRISARRNLAGGDSDLKPCTHAFWSERYLVCAWGAIVAFGNNQEISKI